MAQQHIDQFPSLPRLIRPHQIGAAPHLTLTQKQQYMNDVTQLWDTLESAIQGSQLYKETEQELRQTTLKIYQETHLLDQKWTSGGQQKAARYRKSVTNVPNRSTMAGRIQNRVALVTGAAGGLGRSICLKLASEGAKICCLDLYDTPRNQTNASTGKADDFNTRIEGESTSREINRVYGEPKAMFVKADVTKARQIETAVAKCVEMFGRVSSISAICAVRFST